MVQLWFGVGSVVSGMIVIGTMQLWCSGGLVWLLVDVCDSIWFRYGSAWCGSAPLRFRVGSACHGLVVYV